LHFAIGNQHISVVDDAVGKDDGSREDLVSHCCLFVAGRGTICKSGPAVVFVEFVAVPLHGTLDEARSVTNPVWSKPPIGKTKAAF
jgi:hypothetical protein